MDELQTAVGANGQRAYNLMVASLPVNYLVKVSHGTRGKRTCTQLQHSASGAAQASGQRLDTVDTTTERIAVTGMEAAPDCYNVSSVI